MLLQKYLPERKKKVNYAGAGTADVDASAVVVRSDS